MTMYRNIVLEEKDAVCILSLNNPERRNALTEETKDEMLSALESVNENEKLRALIITGKGPAFCAGGDTRKIGNELSEEEIRRVMQKSQILLKTIVGLRKPVIAAVNGDAFGMGCNLALSADFVVASEKAKFCEVFVKIGAFPDFGALFFLPRLVGIYQSRELLYLGEVIGAEEAKKIGLVYRVVPHKDLGREAENLAVRLGKMPTESIGRMKHILNRSFSMRLEDVLEEEIKEQIYLSKTLDFREGIKALLEKRKPKFQGR